MIKSILITTGEALTSEAEQEPVSESLAIPQGPKRVDCPEDEDFLSALDKMVSENIQERMKEPVKAGNVDISVPVVLKSNVKKTYEQLQVKSKILNWYIAYKVCFLFIDNICFFNCSDKTSLIYD